MTAPTALAIVRIPKLDQVRPAALVYADALGVTWVEPGYADPDPPARSPVHRIEGDVAEAGAGLVVRQGGQDRATVVPWTTPGADDAEGSCAAALAAYSDALVAAGRTVDEERATVLARLRELGELPDGE